MSVELAPEDVLKKYARLLGRATELHASEQSQNDFLAYTKTVWPEFIGGKHHTDMAKKFELVAQGKLKRLIVNMPPRHTKSEFASFLLPSWLMGRNPTIKIMQTTHTAELAFRFGRKVRNLMNSQEYKAVFPNVSLRVDSSSRS